MRKLAIALCALVVLVIVFSYNVWRATEEPVISQPTLVQIGREQLHSQLVAAEERESTIERQDWKSADKLRVLVKAHEDRIQKLTGNAQANEILAYDHASVDRLQKRIAELEAQQASQPQTPADAGAQSPGDAQPHATTPAPTQHPVAGRH